MALRTQIYLTEEQRRRLDEIGRREHRSLAALIREAVDMFVSEIAPDPEAALEDTFGSMPGLEVPKRAEWSARG